MKSWIRRRPLLRPRLPKAFDVTLKAVEVRQFSGYESENWQRVVPNLRRGRYWVTGQPVAGEAPKDFLRVCEGSGDRVKNHQIWPAYIAKVGHKRYPTESITEQLMTRLGEVMGFRLARSRLMCGAGQIRFLSRYFLVDQESLVHGAEIVAGYLADDQFVKAVTEEHLEKELFAFQPLQEAITTRFPQQSAAIMRDFVRMIAFDALVGNQDRHLYNWGVIVHAKGTRAPRFSPIYDTARGLFWNEAESTLQRYQDPPRLLKYVLAAQPLIGFFGKTNPNHFQLIAGIAAADADLASQLRKCINHDYGAVDRMIEAEFKDLLSAERRDLIKRCLRLRHEHFARALEVT